MKTLQEMDLLDDFLFNAVVNYPGIGEAFGRELLRTIFNREFGELRITPQKVYYGADVGYHGARLDVVFDEDISELGKGDIFDIEPEQKKREIEELPKRVRFYHAMIDAKSLKKGERYKNLKRVVVIMIMPVDPFGQNHMVYTIKNHCVEIPHMEYDDGAMTIFLYTRGVEGATSKRLKELLAYMEHTTEENATNEQLQKIHRMVETVKRDSEVSHNYMKIFEREEMIREEAEEVGRYEGRLEGLKSGREEGALQTLLDLVKEQIVDAKYAARKVNMTEEEFQKVLAAQRAI